MSDELTRVMAMFSEDTQNVFLYELFDGERAAPQGEPFKPIFQLFDWPRSAGSTGEADTDQKTLPDLRK